MKNRLTPPPRSRSGWLSYALVGVLIVLACNLPFAASAPSVPAALDGPAVMIQQPANSAQFTQGDSFLFFASANDPLGVIRLDLWVDDTLVLSQSSPDANGLPTLSLSYPMVASKTGSYMLHARAYNSQGGMGESVVHYVTVVEQIASTQEYAQYVVQESDTLENIAARLGVSVDDILRANPHISGGQVKPGQVILIPMPKQPAVAAIPGPNGIQPVSVGPGGGQQPGGGQPVPPPQRPAPVPANPSPQITVKSASVSPNPVYYGANCQAEPTVLNVTAKVEPVASVSKVILAYSFITTAGVRSQDIEIQMQLAGAEYKADVNVGKEAETHLAQAGGQLDLRVEAYDTANKLSTSPIYTINVQFCAAAPPPVNQPTLTVKNVTALTSPVYYGQACTTEPLTTDVVATIDPPNAVQTANLKYYYTGQAGSSGIRVIQMAAIGGLDFGATINASVDAEPHLAQHGGTITLWVEVLDTNGQTSISAPATVTVTFCTAQQGNLPNNLPGVLPAFRPGAVPQPDPGIAQIEPSVFPMPGAVLGPDFGKVKDPSDLKAVSTEGCKITLTWKDNASDETSYSVNRLDPGQPHYAWIASLAPNSTQYEDRTPSPGKYMYYVVATRTLNGAVSGGGSNNAMVDVTLATHCKLAAGPHRLLFQPISFNSSGFPKAYILLTLGKFSPIRVPRAGQDYLPTGDWSAAGEWAIPLPEGVLTKPGDSLIVEVRGTGFSPDGPTDLGGFQRSHTYESLADPAAHATDWSGTDPLARYELAYRLWLDNWQWGGAISDPSIPAPTNLKLDENDPVRHKLTWDYDPKAKPQIDGFAVYSKYSCPGGLQEAHDVVLKGAVGNAANDQRFTVEKQKQPAGCVCLYQVSAFNARGESKLSNPTTGRCETGAPTLKARVTFDTFGMYQGASQDSQFKNQPGNIYLFAGSFMRASATLVLEKGRTYDLQQVYFDGVRNHNYIDVLAAAEDYQFSGAVYTIYPSAIVSPNLCQIDPAPARFSDLATKSRDVKYFLIKGSCGPDCTCELAGQVEIFPVGQGPGAGGGAQAGVGMKDVGETCVDNSECASSYCKAGFCTAAHKGLQGATCFANDQCASGVCGCVYVGRSDILPFGCSGLPSADRSGSCIGPSGTYIDNGGKCDRNEVCASGYCANGLCAPKDGFGRVGDYCHHNNHCGNHYCICPFGYDGDFCKSYQTFTAKDGQHGTCGEWPGAVFGAACTVDNDCQSRHCADHKCAPIVGTGLVGDYCHNGDQCASRWCMCPDGTSIFAPFFGAPSCTGYENFTPTTGGQCMP